MFQTCFPTNSGAPVTLVGSELQNERFLNDFSPEFGHQKNSTWLNCRF
jgi:hypothetical protein